MIQAAIAELTPYINWSFYFSAWGVPGRFPDVFSHPVKGDTARQLYDEAIALLPKMEGIVRPSGIVEEYEARADGNDIVLATETGEVRLHMHRDPDTGYCVADFVQPSGNRATLFTFTAGDGVADLCARYRIAMDDYNAFAVKFLADRLVEAFAEKTLPHGCRIAIGYPSVPDHAIKRDILCTIDPGNSLHLSLTETNMIVPPETVCGIWLENGRYL